MFTFARYVTETIFLDPIARKSLNLPSNIPETPLPQDILPHKTKLLQLFQKTSRPQDDKLLQALDGNEKKVGLAKNWLSSKRKEKKNKLAIKKFTEAAWRFLFYLGLVIFGWSIAFHEPWVWNTKLCFDGHPYHKVDIWHKHYYLLELAIYFHLLVSQFFDVKRNDFWEMFAHHIATIALIVGSYLTNFLRIGMLILLVHDVSDVFLESAKLANYSNKRFLCDCLFVGFASSFFIFRLVIYPFHVYKSVLYDSIPIFQDSYAYYYFNGFLGLLQILHVFWFSLILKMIIRITSTGHADKDLRSESDKSDKED